ncbi:MAG: pyruvoyl-dependent arginine decarboxylase [Thermoplasmata archaeon]
MGLASSLVGVPSRRPTPKTETLVPIPTRFFVTSGRGINKTSELNAFDLALLKAGIGEQNLVSVSSVLPIGIRQIDRAEIARGAITHCVLARHSGGEGEVISTGIAFGFRTDGEGGYIAEGHLHGTQKSLKEFLKWRMEEIAHFRGVELKRIYYRTEELVIPMDHYGVCIAACVFLP